MAKPRITIVGLGLVGGSLGLALQKIKTDFEIVGHDKEPEAAKRAQKMGAIDRVEWNLVSACEHASVVFLCIPVSGMRDTLTAIASYLQPGALVTDSATTKGQVLRWAEEILPDSVNFIGGDPLVGAAQHGLDGASAELFSNARYCLVSPASTPPEAIQLVVDIVSLIGAKPYFIDAAEHDGLVAGLAHMPSLLATALLDAVSRSGAWPEMIKMASVDFRQATAAADTDPGDLRDICLANPGAILRWLDASLESLGGLRRAIAAEDAAGIEDMLNKVHAAREELLHGRSDDNRLAEELDRLDKGRLRQMILGGGPRRKS